jgi:hypothetical protein
MWSDQLSCLAQTLTLKLAHVRVRIINVHVPTASAMNAH